MFVLFKIAFLKSVASVYSVDVETGAETVTVTAGAALTKDSREENRSSIKRTENIEDIMRSYLKGFQRESRDRSGRRLRCRSSCISSCEGREQNVRRLRLVNCLELGAKILKEARLYDILRS